MNQPVAILKRLYTLKVDVATMVDKNIEKYLCKTRNDGPSKTKEWESEHVDNIISVGNTFTSAA